MKKNIFDLTYEEGKNIDKKIRNTSYFKQYITGYLLVVGIFLIMNFMVIILYSDTKYEWLAPIIISISVLGFSIITLMFWFKKFELIKTYYELEQKK